MQVFFKLKYHKVVAYLSKNLKWYTQIISSVPLAKEILYI